MGCLLFGRVGILNFKRIKVGETRQMEQQIQDMLDLQESMNQKVHEKWQEQGFEWYRAIWIESAEMLDHFGWKWWKKQNPDMDQVKLELIDIWHFGLSELLQQGTDRPQLISVITDALEVSTSVSDFKEELELFVEEVLRIRSFSPVSFKKLMDAIGMTFDELYAGYIGKNVLNFFRQDHGYQTGTYRKVWGGKEDNEHLVDAIGALDVASDDFQGQLYRALESRYLETAD